MQKIQRCPLCNKKIGGAEKSTDISKETGKFSVLMVKIVYRKKNFRREMWFSD
jgi:hypothetical protein